MSNLPRRPLEPGEYAKLFHSSKAKRKAALDRAWQTRNFEIELYWKRATYFWTILGALFVAYGFAVKADEAPDKDLRLIIACLGAVLSLAWYLVNRGSAAWQQNWEAHVDALEDAVTGPLYKTVRRSSRVAQWHPFGPLNMSPSKITIAVALFVFVCWTVLVARESMSVISIHLNVNSWPAVAVLTAAVMVSILIIWTGQSSKSDNPLEFEMRQRRQF